MSLSLIQKTLLIILCLFNQFALAETQGQAAIATAHPLATQAGKEVLLKGGNAFDAAVAITAALAVVEPYGSGLGGGGFWLLHREKDGKQIMIDGRETAPASAHRRMYLDKDGKHVKEKSLNGPTAAGIPGVVAGMDHLARQYGRLPLEQSLTPAIELAKNGFPVTKRYQQLLEFRKSVIQQHPDAAKIFLKNNEVPALDELIIQNDLASTLESIAAKGSVDFYRGELAEKLVNGVNKHGGIWSSLDLKSYQVKERKPIISQYRDMKITSAALPSSGGIVLAQALGILEHYKLRWMNTVEARHYIVEAMRRAYRDRAAYLGDADHVDVPVDRLLNKDYLHGLAVSIDPQQASSSEQMGVFDLQQSGTHTTHFSVMDKEGNRVAATLSINLPFGSGFVVPGTGVLLNDEMDDFSSKPLSPNAYGLVGSEANSIAPGKRPLSSMSPTFIETEDKIGVLGTPGGSRIISMVLLGILDFEKGHFPRSWVSIPRYHHQYLPDEIQFELDGLSFEERLGLQSLGHTLKERNRKYGNMQAIMYFKPKQYLMAASDPRGEGEAIVFTY